MTAANLLRSELRRAICVGAAILLLIGGAYYVQARIYSHLTLPDTQFVTKDLHHGCWAIFTDDSCWNRDYYVTSSPESVVRSAIEKYLEHKGFVVVEDQYGDILFGINGQVKRKFISIGADSSDLPEPAPSKLTACLSTPSCTIIKVEN